MTSAELLVELKRQPYPKCCRCTTRAHGLFALIVNTTGEPAEGDEVLETSQMWISYLNKETNKRKALSLTKSTVRRHELLCASHGFSVAHTTLIRSLNTKARPKPEPAPCTMIQLPGMAQPMTAPNGMTASQLLNLMRKVK